eukprot:jgi/Undpi1/598/HiC_scaffold_10.g04062.m1
MANDLHIELEMLRDLTLVTLVACSLQAARPAAAYLALTPRSCRFQPRAGASMPTAVPTYEKAKAAVDKATSNFADVPTIGAKDVLRLRQEGKKVLLIDVRTEEEMKVSILRGALTKDVFENSSLGESARTGIHYQESYGGAGDDWDVVVPYCTVGYRSGQYAKKLIDLGYPSVRNSEGVVLWTHDIGSGLVVPKADRLVERGAPANAGKGKGVKRVHVYGPPWNHAREDFETVFFAPTGW